MEVFVTYHFPAYGFISQCRCTKSVQTLYISRSLSRALLRRKWHNESANHNNTMAVGALNSTLYPARYKAKKDTMEKEQDNQVYIRM